MPGYTDALKKFRDSGYSGKDAPKPEQAKDDEEPAASRTIQLTDDEIQSLGDAQPGADMLLEVEGRLEDHGFRIMTVRSANGGGQKSDDELLMEKMRGDKPPMMQPQTVPSPS